MRKLRRTFGGRMNSRQRSRVRKAAQTRQQRRNERNQKRRRKYRLGGRDKVHLTIEGPFCAPTRFALTEALTKGVKGDPESLFQLEVTKDYVRPADPRTTKELWAAEMKTLKNLRYGGPLGMMYMGFVCRTDFSINANAVVLAEECIERHPEIYLVGKRFDKGSRVRSRRHRELPSGYRPKAFKSIRDIVGAAKECEKSGAVDNLPGKHKKAWGKAMKQLDEGEGQL